MKTLLSSFVLATLLILSPADARAEIPPDDVLIGDVNGDDVVDFGDIGSFVDILRSGDYQASADFDCNQVVDFADIPMFLELFLFFPGE